MPKNGKILYMNALFPILAAVLQASSFTLDKIILSIKHVSFKTYIGVSFPLIFFIDLAIFLIFRTPFSLSLFTDRYLWLLIASVFLTIVNNILYYRALDNDRLGEIETFGLLAAIPVVIFSGIIFADERNLFILIPAFIAASAVAWSHWGKKRFEIAKNTRVFFIWSLVSAPIGAAISKTLLASWNPVSLELVRSGFLALVFGYIFFRHIKNILPKAKIFLLITNILTAIAWLLFYFSYQRSGIVYTVLLFSIQPLLVYLASLFILKEPPNRKKIIAFAIVLVSIAVAQIFK